MAGSEDGKGTGSTCIEKQSGTKELNQADRAEDYTIQGGQSRRLHNTRRTEQKTTQYKADRAEDYTIQGGQSRRLHNTRRKEQKTTQYKAERAEDYTIQGGQSRRLHNTKVQDHCQIRTGVPPSAYQHSLLLLPLPTPLHRWWERHFTDDERDCYLLSSAPGTCDMRLAVWHGCSMKKGLPRYGCSCKEYILHVYTVYIVS